MAKTSQMIESARQQFGELGAGMTYFRSPSGIQIRRDRNYSAPVAASSLTPARSGRSAVRASATGSERSLMRTNQMSRDTASACLLNHLVMKIRAKQCFKRNLLKNSTTLFRLNIWVKVVEIAITRDYGMLPVSARH